MWAIGDLIDTPQLAHVGYAEAIFVIKQLLGEPAFPVRYDRVPWAIYCHPEVAWAGPSEDEARKPATTSSSASISTGRTAGRRSSVTRTDW